MADFPALPLWTDAYLADTSHLTEAEHGRYLLMLMQMWRSPQCRFPADRAWLERRFKRTPEEFDRDIQPLLTEFFRCTGNWWTQKRLQQEWRYVRARAEKRSDAAKSRWNKERQSARGEPDAADSRARARGEIQTDTDKPLSGKEKGRCNSNAPTPTPTGIGEPTGSPYPLKKDPASPDHASRTSAAQVGRAAGAPPAQDKGTNNQPRDFDWIMENLCELYADSGDPQPFECRDGSWHPSNGETRTAAQAYHEYVDDVIVREIAWCLAGKQSNASQQRSAKGLANRALRACGPKTAYAIMGKLTGATEAEPDDPRAYLMAAIRKAETGEQRPAKPKPASKANGPDFAPVNRRKFEMMLEVARRAPSDTGAIVDALEDQIADVTQSDVIAVLRKLQDDIDPEFTPDPPKSTERDPYLQ